MSKIEDIMIDLAACLCVAMEATDGPPLCFCGILPGAEIVEEYIGGCSDGNGMAWVRLAAAYPSTVVGQQDETLSNCKKPLGIDVEIGAIRKGPVPDSRGRPPTAADQAAAATLQINDMLAMHHAIECCGSLKRADYQLNAYTPGASGDTLGGIWLLSVGS